MDYGMIGKIDKAKRYAEQRSRIRIKSFTVSFEGENMPRTVYFENGVFHCDCDFFAEGWRCSHTMALKIILDEMIMEPEPVPATDAARRAKSNTQFERMRSPIPLETEGEEVASAAKITPKTRIPKPSKEDERLVFHTDSEFSATILQDALAPFLSALTELQHLIDELSDRPASQVVIRNITSYD